MNKKRMTLDERIQIRVTKRDKEFLQKRAKLTDNTLTELLVRGGKEIPITDRNIIKRRIKVLREFTLEFNKIGVNINQISTNLNILSKTNQNLSNEELTHCRMLIEEYLKSYVSFRRLMAQIVSEGWFICVGEKTKKIIEYARK